MHYHRVCELIKQLSANQRDKHSNQKGSETFCILDYLQCFRQVCGDYVR